MSPQKTVMPDPPTGRVICWSSAVVVQVVTKALSGTMTAGGGVTAGGGTTETPTPTLMVRSLLPLSKTSAPEAFRVTVYIPFSVGADLKESVSEDSRNRVWLPPGTIRYTGLCPSRTEFWAAISATSSEAVS